jgi:hypothetical protein
MQVYEAEIYNWKWDLDESYGIARIKGSKREALISPFNCLELKKSHPEGFLDDMGKEIIIYPPQWGIPWFDPFETIYFTLNPDLPNIAQNISFYNNGALTKLAAAGVSVSKPYYMQRRIDIAKSLEEEETHTLVDIDDELEQAQHKIANYEDSTDDEDSVNPTKATPVKPSRRVGIPPSPGEVLTPVRRPTGRKQESPRVGVPPSPSE